MREKYHVEKFRKFEIKTHVNLMFDVFLQLCKVCKANKFRFQKLQNGSSTQLQSYTR